MPTIDLTKPAPVAPSGKVHNMQEEFNRVGPIPVGTPMIIKNPTPLERKALIEAGWDGKSAVPDNMHEFINNLKKEMEAEQLAPPVPLDTPPLQYEERDINDLPPAEQNKYKEAMRELFADAEQRRKQAAQADSDGERYDRSVLQAITSANEPNVVDDLPKGERVDVARDAEPTTHRLNCARCGFPTDMDDPTEVTHDDKLAYLQTLSGLMQFVKTYHLFGGKLTVTLRSLSPDEVDAIHQQVLLDAGASTMSQTDRIEHYSRYRTALQVVELVAVGGDGLHVRFPRHYRDWQVTKDNNIIANIWAMFSQTACKSETMYRVLTMAVGSFNMLTQKLEMEAQNPNFWQAAS